MFICHLLVPFVLLASIAAEERAGMLVPGVGELGVGLVPVSGDWHERTRRRLRAWGPRRVRELRVRA